jgi:hypothetical protein
MQLTCFACNATGSIEAFTRDEAAGELVALAGSLPPSLWRALQAYIGLFRTSRKLSFDKALRIAKETLALTPNQAALEQAMLSTFDAIRTKGGKALTNQNYLKEVLENQAALAPQFADQFVPADIPRSKAAQAIAALQEWAAGDWLRSGIAAGLAACVAQNLTKTPAAEIITLNADTWYLALKKQLTIAEIDAPRLHQAFEILLPKLTEWPQPKQLLEQLPKRPVRPAIRHEPSAEEFAQTAAKARQLREEAGI